MGTGGAAVPLQLGEPLASRVLDPDLDKYRRLFWALLALLVFGIVAIFGLGIPAARRRRSVAGLVIFSGYTIVDFDRLARRRERGADRSKHLPGHHGRCFCCTGAVRWRSVAGRRPWHALAKGECVVNGRVAVIYYSASGNVHSLAQAVADGAEEAGAEVRRRHVEELASELVISQSQHRADTARSSPTSRLRPWTTSSGPTASRSERRPVSATSPHS